MNEGSNVTLVCMANGRPEPVITWRHLTPTGKQPSSPPDVIHYLEYPHVSVIPLDRSAPPAGRGGDVQVAHVSKSGLSVSIIEHSQRRPLT